MALNTEAEKILHRALHSLFFFLFYLKISETKHKNTNTGVKFVSLWNSCNPDPWEPSHTINFLQRKAAATCHWVSVLGDKIWPAVEGKMHNLTYLWKLAQLGRFPNHEAAAWNLGHSYSIIITINIFIPSSFHLPMGISTLRTSQERLCLFHKY